MKKIFSVFILIFVLMFIYLPILILAVYSFTSSPTIGTIRGFSWQNYMTLFTTEELLDMIKGTILLALCSAFIATILGTLGAIGAYYSKKVPKTIMHQLNQIPMVNADVVTGFSICIFLIVVLNMNKESFVPLVIGHVVLTVPFVYLSVVPKLKQFDNSLYEAALDMGAKPIRALVTVLLPQIASGIFSGFMMAVTLSLDDYFIATYTKPATFDTISTYVVNATKGAQTNIKTALWALSTVIFVLVVIVVVVMNIRAGKEKAHD